MLWIGPISDHERTNPSSSARTIAPAATPMNRLRECSYALAFWAMRALVLAVVAFASSVACWSRSIASGSASMRRESACTDLCARRR